MYRHILEHDARGDHVRRSLLATARAAVEASGDVFTRKDLEDAVAVLEKNNAPRFGDFYSILLTTKQAWNIDFWVAFERLPTERAKVTMLELYRYESRRVEIGRAAAMPSVKELAARAMLSS